MVLDVFGCQGNFFLWVITEARERWFTLGWLRLCAWTAAAVGWMGPHREASLPPLFGSMLRVSLLTSTCFPSHCTGVYF